MNFIRRIAHLTATKPQALPKSNTWYAELHAHTTYGPAFEFTFFFKDEAASQAFTKAVDAVGMTYNEEAIPNLAKFSYHHIETFSMTPSGDGMQVAFYGEGVHDTLHFYLSSYDD